MMKIETTKVRFELGGRIEDGFEVPLARYQRGGSGRRITGWTATVNASGLEVLLLARVVNKDGGLRNSTTSYTINSWDKPSWELPQVQALMGTIHKMISETYPLEVLGSRPSWITRDQA